MAYQGMPGAYSEMAARKAVTNCNPLPCDQFEVAFQALDGWLADRAVLPIENSLGGSIHTVYDLLIRCVCVGGGWGVGVGCVCVCACIWLGNCE